MATLIHDDIIDDSDLRRGNISIQAEFGKDVAVYAGDLLFTNFFDLMLDTTTEHEYLVRNAQTMSHILNGELAEVDTLIQHTIQTPPSEFTSCFINNGW